MKQLCTLFTLIAFLAIQSANAQCLPNGITFFSQAEINAFPINYPDCYEINGDVVIGGGSDITDLTPLSQINYIRGWLRIIGNANLTTLEGLNVYVVGSGSKGLSIDSNEKLTDISALQSLDSVLAPVNILFNDALESLEGLEGLEYVKGVIGIGGNDVLDGADFIFEDLTYCGGLNFYNNAGLVQLPSFPILEKALSGVTISDNPSLTSISGLTIQGTLGSLVIDNNDALTDLIGIAPLSLPFSGETLTLTNNNALSLCSVVSICNRLTLSTNSVTISGNTAGCNSIIEVQADCASSGCPTTDLLLSSQAEVNDFPRNYSNCANFSGSLNIEEGTNFGDITDLTPLRQLKSIGGHLYIFGNDDLELLIGLENLESVGDYLSIDNNDKLLAPFGLSALKTIGDRFFILDNDEMETLWGLWSLETIGDGLSVQNNKVLQDFYGLRYVTSLGGGPLNIRNNDSLRYMAAIRSVNPTTIGSVRLEDNPVLSVCHVRSICGFLDNPTGSINISGNAAGCGSQSAVEAACENLFGTQIGAEIVGSASPDDITYFGNTLALSADGTRLASGDIWANDYHGQVKVFELQNNTWSQLGSDINGKEWDGAYGAEVALSDNGNRLVVGAIYVTPNPNIDEVQTFDWINNTWTPVGDSIISNLSNPNNPSYSPDEVTSTGTGFSLSGDGMRLSVLDRDRVTLPNVVGEVRIYQWQNNNWTQLGNSILGESSPNQQFDFSETALSQNGSRVVIGYRGTNNDFGIVRVYEYSGSNWNQVGNDLSQGMLDDNFGANVDISNDGNRVVISSNVFNGTSGQSGENSRLWVYEWQVNQWVQLGDAIEGNGDRFGYDVLLSGDGNRIATSAEYDDTDGDGAGKIMAYKWSNNDWALIGDAFYGQDQYEHFGTGLAYSADGNTIAGGGNGSTFDDLGVGVIRVYGLPMSVSTTNISGIEVEVFPNPTADFVYIKGISPDIVFVADAMGRVVKQQRSGNHQIDLSQLPVGVYFLEIGKDMKWATVKVIKE